MRMAWSTVGAHIVQRPGQAAYQMLETRRRGSVLRLGNPKRGIVSRRRYHTLRGARPTRPPPPMLG